jgi:ERF superfamily
MKELLSALARARKKFKPAFKDKTNPHHRSGYVSIESLIGASDEQLIEEGLLLTGQIDYREHNSTYELIATLHHIETGQKLPSLFPLIVPPSHPNPMQGMGSAQTYGRKFSRELLCDLSRTDDAFDDDGEGAFPRQSAPQFNQVKEIRLKKREAETATKPASTAHAPHLVIDFGIFESVTANEAITWGREHKPQMSDEDKNTLAKLIAKKQKAELAEKQLAEDTQKKIEQKRGADNYRRTLPGSRLIPTPEAPV